METASQPEAHRLVHGTACAEAPGRGVYIASPTLPGRVRLSATSPHYHRRGARSEFQECRGTLSGCCVRSASPPEEGRR
jgi:hypothetical protein